MSQTIDMLQNIVLPTYNKMVLPSDPYVDYIIHDNKVCKLCRIKCIIPFDNYFEKTNEEHIYNFFTQDEKGIWLCDHILNKITIEQIHRHDIFDTKLYASGIALEKDYIFYILKWGQQ